MAMFRAPAEITQFEHMETRIFKTDAVSGGPDTNAWIKDTTTQDFVADVLDASRETPVIVDFWAPWCGPCRQLGPILEAAVKAARGAVRLVKLDIDKHPAVASQMGVRSIPAVFAFKDGRPLDGFMGALPESQVRAFVERLAGAKAADDAAERLEMANAALESGDVAAAAQMFAALLQQNADNLGAIAGLAKCYVQTGDLERAEQTLALVPPAKRTIAPVAGADAMLDLARKTQQAGDTEPLERRVAADPNDFQARYDLAIALNARGDKAGALDQLLAIIARDRGWNDEAARKQLLQLFEAWGPTHPATVSGRQRLSSVLFS